MNFTGPFSDVPYRYRDAAGRHIDIRKTAWAETLPVPLEDLKLDLRVDSDDEDATIGRIAYSAAALLEKRSACAVVRGDYEALFHESPCYAGGLEIRRWPLRAVTAIAYFDESASPPGFTDLDLASFYIEERAQSFVIYLAAGATIPATNRVRVSFSAGCDSAPAESGASEDDDGISKPLDPGMKGVFIALVAHFYANREIFEADKISQVESSAGGLLSSVRTYW